MTAVRIRFEQRGGHMHCRVFMRTAETHAPHGTYQKVGDFILDSGAQWEDFVAMMQQHTNVQFLPEDERL